MESTCCCKALKCRSKQCLSKSVRHVCAMACHQVGTLLIAVLGNEVSWLSLYTPTVLSSACRCCTGAPLPARSWATQLVARRLACKNCHVSAADTSTLWICCRRLYPALQAAAVCSEPNAPGPPASTAPLAGAAAAPAAQVCSPQVMPAVPIVRCECRLIAAPW